MLHILRNPGYENITYNNVDRYRKLNDGDIMLLVSNLPSLLRTSKYIRDRYNKIDTIKTNIYNYC
jgi:hypothetical protein